jgi:hypothetical protein
MAILGNFILENATTDTDTANVAEGVSLLLDALKRGSINARKCVMNNVACSEDVKFKIAEIINGMEQSQEYIGESCLLYAHLLSSYRDDDSWKSIFNFLSKADEQNLNVIEDMNWYLGKHFVVGQNREKALDFLRRKAEAGSVEAKFFLGLNLLNDSDPLKKNEAASLIVETLISGNGRYSERYIRAYTNDNASLERRVLCFMLELYIPRSEVLRSKLVGFSDVFEEGFALSEE